MTRNDAVLHVKQSFFLPESAGNELQKRERTKVRSRRISWYLRLEARIAEEQIGWTEGMGAPEVGLILQGAIQQAKRLQTNLYILYIDLATMFPKVRRDLASIAELLTGLPPDVVRLTEMVYGAHRDREGAVRCQYDTAAGLGVPFANHMGRLMGCPLSPASAKILLNSILIAISAHVKGVRIWQGEAPAWEELGDDQWRRVVQLAFADDWCGILETADQLHAAWDMWSMWALISGSKLGVKKLAKTVVT